MPPTRLRPGSYWQPTPIVEAWPFASTRSDVATRHRVSPRPTAALPPAPSHAPCRPTAAHCSSPPAHNTGPVPPATAAVVGHCRTPYPQLPRRTPAATARPIISWASCALVRKAAHRLPAAAPSPPPIPGVGRAPGPERPRRDGCHRPGIRTVLHLPRRAAVLSLYPHRLLALLEKPRLPPTTSPFCISPAPSSPSEPPGY